MADQDFNIKVVTTADTSGIKQTSRELEQLKNQQAMFAETARRQAAAATATAAKAQPAAEAGGGFSGTAVGIGTIVTLVGYAVRQINEFEKELDRAAEAMLKSQERMRALGESIVETQDQAISLERIGVEPLAQSFARLQHEIAVAKEEQKLLDLPSQGEEWKKLNKEIAFNQSLLDKVTSGIDRQTAATEKAQKAARSELEKRVPGLKSSDEIKEADAQTQAILKNEQAAIQARAEGRDKDAEMFQKSADQYKASATPKQLEDLKRIHELQDQLNPQAPSTPYLQPQPGESGGYNERFGEGGAGLSPTENLLNMQKRNDEYHRRNDASMKRLRDQQRAGTIEQEERQNPDLAETNKYIKQAGGKPITQEHAQAIDLKQAIEDLGAKFDRYWG